jgi:hypothetical protein
MYVYNVKKYNEFSTQCSCTLNFVIGQSNLIEEVFNSTTRVRISK